MSAPIRHAGGEDMGCTDHTAGAEGWGTSVPHIMESVP